MEFAYELITFNSFMGKVPDSVTDKTVDLNTLTENDQQAWGRILV